MQVSILIPVYNYDCANLLQAIDNDLQEINNLDYEVLLGDDASSEEYRSIYLTYEQRYSQVSILHCAENIGASRLRNRLAEEAHYPNLLFFDSDVVPNKGTIRQYLEAIVQYPSSLIYGGFYYDEGDLTVDNQLRYRYGLQIEMRNLAERKAKPYQSFITMAFALPKDLLLAYPFPDIGMGYEDALWGAILESHKVEIQHIDAAVRHGLKENDDVFLKTLEVYVANLAKHRDLFTEARIKLLQTYTFFEKCHLLSLLSVFGLFERVLIKLMKRNILFRLSIKVLKLVFLHRAIKQLRERN